MKGLGVAVGLLAVLAWASTGSAAPLGQRVEVWVGVKRGGVIVPGLAALYEDGPPEMAPDHYDEANKNWIWILGTPQQKRMGATMAYAGENVLVEPHEPTITPVEAWSPPHA